MKDSRYTIEEFDGDSDCEPPEPGKKWLAINRELEEGDWEELCIIVHRGDMIPQEKYDLADEIIHALVNYHNP